MTLIKRTIQRTSQPQGAVQVNWGNPAAPRFLLPFNGNAREIVSGVPVTVGSGASFVARPSGLVLNASGSAAVASLPINLSASGIVNVSFWLDWPSYANDYAMALEYTADGGANHGFYISPNQNGGFLEISSLGSSGGPVGRYTRPSAGLHHYAVNINKNAAAGSGGVELYVDGVLLAPASSFGAGSAGNFANSSFFIFSRNNSSLYGAGRMHNLCIRPGVRLSAAQAASEYRNPWQLFAPQELSIWVPVTAGGSTGTSATTNANDTSSASGTTTVVGTSAATNAADTSSASGSVGSPVSGTSATTNANDTSAAAGTTAVVGTSTTTNAADTASAQGWAGTVSGTVAATNNDDVSSAIGDAGEPRRSVGAGKSRKRRKYQVEIDGEVFAVSSAAEAEEIILEKAKERETLALQRAQKANVRPVRKVVADARKTLSKLEVSAPPDLSAEVDAILANIQQRFEDTLKTIEISALLRKREREEEDDEEILLLL